MPSYWKKLLTKVFADGSIIVIFRSRNCFLHCFEVKKVVETDIIKLNAWGKFICEKLDEQCPELQQHLDQPP